MATTIETTTFGAISNRSTAVLVRESRILDPRGNDVCELIEAAGPLSIRDLAGGLNLPLPEVAAQVRRMASEERLQQDEWERYTTAA
jgi:predicted transcriptional regulator